MYRFAVALILAASVWTVAPQAQSPGPGVPRLVPASGLLFNEAGKPISGNNVKVTFAVYAGAEDEEALWSETLRLNVVAGRYDALIGSSSPGGIPAAVFAGGEPRWLGVTADKAVAPPRVIFVSVPYALTADDATKLGGHPVSAFVLKEESDTKSSATPAGWKQAVDEEAAARSAADTTLQNSVDAEASARSAADTTLQSNVDAESSARSDADTALQNSLDATSTELHSKIDAKSTELDSKIAEEKTTRETKDTEIHTKIDQTKTEVDSKIDQTKTELNTKIDVTKNELTTKILFETSKVTSDQDVKLLALKNELKNDSSEKVNELDQKKTGKEEFEQEKQKKQIDIDDLREKKTSREEFEQEKQKRIIDIDDLRHKKLEKEHFDQEKASKDFEINDLKEKKLSKAEYLLEKATKELEFEDLKQRKLEKTDFEAEKFAKNAALGLLDAKKVEKTEFEAEKTAKQQQIDAINAKLITEKDRVDTLQKFVVSFAREPNGAEMPDRWMCPEGTVAIGIVGQTADPFGTASPFCSPVTGATLRADGGLAATFNGPFAVPGTEGEAPTYELMCPASHAVVGIFRLTTGSGIVVTEEDENGNMPMRALCRRMFSTFEGPSAASVPVPAFAAGPSCPANQTAAGIVRSAGSIAVACR